MANEYIKQTSEAIYRTGSDILHGVVEHGADIVYFDWESSGHMREYWETEARRKRIPGIGQIFAGSNNSSSIETMALSVRETNPKPEGITGYRRESLYHLTPGFLLTARTLQELEVEVSILSNGFVETIPDLGFPITANSFAYQPGNSNRITGFCDGEMMTQRDGKLLSIIEQRRNRSGDQRIVMVGDGKNDAATQPTALFMLFTGVIRRKNVIDELREAEHLPPVIPSDYSEILVMLAGEPRWPHLLRYRNPAVRSHFANGVQRIIDNQVEFINPLDQMAIAARLEYFINRG